MGLFQYWNAVFVSRTHWKWVSPINKYILIYNTSFNLLDYVLSWDFLPKCILSKWWICPFGLVYRKCPLRTCFRQCKTLVQQNFIFVSCFLRSHFLLAAMPFEKVLQNGCSYARGSLARDIPSIGDSTWQAAFTLLAPASIPSTLWCRLCWQPDWAPFWLGACTCAPDHSWSIQTCRSNFTASCTPGSLGGISLNDRRVAMTLTCPWWSLEVSSLEVALCPLLPWYCVKSSWNV